MDEINTWITVWERHDEWYMTVSNPLDDRDGFSVTFNTKESAQQAAEKLKNTLDEVHSISNIHYLPVEIHS